MTENFIVSNSFYCSLESITKWAPGHYQSLANDKYDYDFNSLAPGRYGCNFECVIFRFMWRIDVFCETALWWMLQDFKSTVIQVMAWCRKAASHYLSQCWPCFMMPYGVTKGQWVNAKWIADVPILWLLWCQNFSLKEHTVLWLIISLKDSNLFFLSKMC